ncbi:MAG: DUF3192 domain-containing protein [Candidatus Omnitrophota bacterium]|nr:DUF3192 domain-containing protein [Candidatus Omnitrophota bacterium]
MRKAIVLLLGAVLISGCATTVTLQDMTSANRQNLLRLSIGMTKNEALNAMGTETKTAKVALYQYGNWAETPVESMKINNPYRNEILRGKDDKIFEVLYYVTDVRKSDTNTSEDELTPLVFDNGKLIGWGWSFLQDNVQKYELRMR